MSFFLWVIFGRVFRASLVGFYFSRSLASRYTSLYECEMGICSVQPHITFGRVSEPFRCESLQGATVSRVKWGDSLKIGVIVGASCCTVNPVVVCVCVNKECSQSSKGTYLKN